jgi:formate hydrogenlyase subunit 6/NADH:ubiquinone oxidoreductase subunit I
MQPGAAPESAKYLLAARDFPALVSSLQQQGYTLIGPQIVDGDFTYSPLTALTDLPVGWTDRQEAGTFRLEKRADEALFGCGLGQHAWKRFLFPPDQVLWEAERVKGGWRFVERTQEAGKPAFIGVRACDLQALETLDRVFLRGAYVDPGYQARREQALIVAVNCTRAGGTCFCASMGTGPRVTFGFDLVLTEVLDREQHYFLVGAGTSRGTAILAAIPTRPAEAGEIAAAEALVAQTAKDMVRHLDTEGLKELLYRNYEHPHWLNVASRCLTCGNCAMVCPTCFCHTVEDGLDLSGNRAERRRLQQVCFALDFTYIHGGSVRPSPMSRYRQWLTHKLATWTDQFGCLGCVGCGRCITWCPVGIDITEEVRTIREQDEEKIGKGEAKKSLSV